MNKKKISEVLEQGVINNLKMGNGIYQPCEACGEMTQMCELESVLFDEERTPALVCGKCYFGAEERADELEWDEELPVKEEHVEDTRGEALDDIASGKW